MEIGIIPAAPIVKATKAVAGARRHRLLLGRPNTPVVTCTSTRRAHMDGRTLARLSFLISLGSGHDWIYVAECRQGTR